MQSPWQFSIFRIIFGTYLAIHFAMLAPWAAEVFGSSGVMADPALNPAHGLFPNPLDLKLPDGVVTGFVVLLALAAVSFAAGCWRKPMAALLWFGSTALFHRNNLIGNPALPYTGLLLVLTLLVPSGEPLSRGERRMDWSMPVWVPRCAWILMAAGYSFSGITKIGSPSWMDGSAIARLLENPLARPGWVGISSWRCRTGCYRRCPGGRWPWKLCSCRWRCGRDRDRGSGWQWWACTWGSSWWLISPISVSAC